MSVADQVACDRTPTEGSVAPGPFLVKEAKGVSVASATGPTATTLWSMPLKEPPVTFDWAAAIRARDEQAWRSLHDREFAVLYRSAIALGADPGLAEDAASESFIRLLRELPRVKLASPEALRSWLLVVCRNYLRDEFRKRGSDRSLEGFDTPSAEVDQTTPAVLADAIKRLPDAQREVVVLRFVAGLPTREVAAMTGRGIEAVESLQHRALGALRRSLGPTMEGK